MPQHFVTAVWDSTKRPVLALSLVVFYRWLGAERVRFVDDRIDAGYATYRTLANLDVSIESLFPVQLGLGPVPIASTPHFSFVKAHLGHQGEVWSKDGWKDYMINESSSPPGSVEPRQERFERLIDHISDNPNDVHLLVALTPRLRGFEIVDDFLERQSWRLVGLDRLCRAAWSVISLHKQGRASLGGSFRSQALQPHVSVQQ